MNTTYERDVSHCEPSGYIKLSTVKSVDPAENSDNLLLVKFVEYGWQAVVNKDAAPSVGDSVLFIPPESVLPLELSEILGVTKYLKKGRVSVARLRGNRSEGLIANPELVAPYKQYIMQWETLPTIQMAGKLMPKIETPFEFETFYKMPNLMNEPSALRIGEDVCVSEKIHGTNVRFGRLTNPSTNKPQLYVGSHKTTRKELGDGKDDIYWRVIRETLTTELPLGMVFYGEIYGRGVQDIEYGLKNQSLAVFSVAVRGSYLPAESVFRLCNLFKLPCVAFVQRKYKGLEWARGMAEEPSELYEGIREGVVIASKDFPRNMAKVINFQYLIRGGGTERH